MNVIGSRPDGWWQDRHGAMARLVRHLDRWVAAAGEEVAVVFERPPSPPIDSSAVEVTGARHGGANAADDEIVRRVGADHEPRSITVVTSDRELARRVRAAGASVEPAAAFRSRLDAV